MLFVVCFVCFGDKVNDFVDLLNVCINSGCKFAISEFNNPVVIDLAKEKGLEIIEITKRKTIRNINTEILIVNYEVNFNMINLWKE